MKKPNPKPPPNETPFERFERLAKKVVTVPKTKVEEDREARRESRLFGKSR